MRTYSVLDCDTNKLIIVGIDYGGQILLAIACSVATTMNPDEDRERTSYVIGGVDINEETIFVRLAVVNADYTI